MCKCICKCCCCCCPSTVFIVSCNCCNVLCNYSGVIDNCCGGSDNGSGVRDGGGKCSCPNISLNGPALMLVNIYIRSAPFSSSLFYHFSQWYLLYLPKCLPNAGKSAFRWSRVWRSRDVLTRITISCRTFFRTRNATFYGTNNSHNTIFSNTYCNFV